jgi:hypothetical protein
MTLKCVGLADRCGLTFSRAAYGQGCARQRATLGKPGRVRRLFSHVE